MRNGSTSNEWCDNDQNHMLHHRRIRRQVAVQVVACERLTTLVRPTLPPARPRRAYLRRWDETAPGAMAAASPPPPPTDPPTSRDGSGWLARRARARSRWPARPPRWLPPDARRRNDPGRRAPPTAEPPALLRRQQREVIDEHHPRPRRTPAHRGADRVQRVADAVERLLARVAVEQCTQIARQ